MFSPINSVGCLAIIIYVQKLCVALNGALWLRVKISVSVWRRAFDKKFKATRGEKCDNNILYIKKSFRAEHAINFPPLYGNFQRRALKGIPKVCF
jgi:hypothetical protein